ncbi:MAG: hypothetical protein R3A52_32010 [Polyangiales bacterium]
MIVDPPRLADASDDPALRDALRGARDDGPDAAQFARMRVRLPRGAPPSGGGGGAPRYLLPLGLAAAMAIFALTRGASAPVARAVTPLTVRAPTTTTSPPAPASPVVEASPDPPAQAPAPTPAAPSPRQPRRAVNPAPHAAPAVVADPAPRATAACDVIGETERLQRAQTSLREGRWAAVRAACADDARACPAGPLAEERERLWIEALSRDGHDVEARARWERFRRRYPSSSYGERLRALWPNEAP